jgi:exodeoxyribonuclease-3
VRLGQFRRCIPIAEAEPEARGKLSDHHLEHRLHRRSASPASVPRATRSTSWTRTGVGGAAAAAVSSSDVRLATFNINGITTRLANLLEYLAREQPDVVAVQELKATDAQFPAKALADAGYEARWVGERAWNGVAILARGAPIIEIRRALPGMEDDPQARYLEAAVQGIVVAALYLPNGNPIKSPKFAYKLRWFEALIAHAQRLFDSGHPVVLLGDFNVVPTDDDIYNPKSWARDALLQPASRACFQRLLAQGWVDALRTKHADGRIYTFWDYFRNHWARDAGLRIDHLLLAPALREADVARWVRDRAHASDHAPAWIELALGASTPSRALRKRATPDRPKAPRPKRVPRPAKEPRASRAPPSANAARPTRASRQPSSSRPKRAPPR